MSQKLPKIFVMSKLQFEDTIKYNCINDNNVEELYKTVAFICINDSSGDYYYTPLLEEHVNVLNLRFDDITHELEFSPTNKKTAVLFTDEDAEKIIEFLDNNKDVNSIIVHCAGGISRSGAIGTFCLEYLNGDREQFYTTNKFIVPNQYILGKLKEKVK